MPDRIDTVGNIWRKLAKRFENAKISEARLDARLLVAHALGINQLQLVVDEKSEIGNEELAQIEKLALRRLGREPVARILGFKEFYGLEFLLNEATLTPRPETELLVDRSLEIFGDKIFADKNRPKILELGVGSGCVIISLLYNLPGSSAVGVDISKQALEAAKNNGEQHGVDNRINWFCGSWFEPLAGEEKFDLILANPPYIDGDAMKCLSPEVGDFDPDLALFGGGSGLEAYKQIIPGAKNLLVSDGVLLLEIGFDQSTNVMDFCRVAGFSTIKLHLDMAGQPRMIEASY